MALESLKHTFLYVISEAPGHIRYRDSQINIPFLEANQAQGENKERRLLQLIVSRHRVESPVSQKLIPS